MFSVCDKVAAFCRTSAVTIDSLHSCYARIDL